MGNLLTRYFQKLGHILRLHLALIFPFALHAFAFNIDIKICTYQVQGKWHFGITHM